MIGVHLADELRARGVRVTQPRQLVWDVLVSEDRHLSAAEVAARVRLRDPGVNQSSVYRALTLFAELDLVRESRAGDDAASSWEVRHPDRVIHLVCDACGAVVHRETATVEALHRELAADPAFAVAAIDVRVTGRCAACTTPG